MNTLLVALTYYLFSVPAHSALPPIRDLISSMVLGRPQGRPVEISIRHRIETEPGQYVNVEESVLSEGSQMHSLWRFSNTQEEISGALEGGRYALAGDLQIPTQSQLRLRVLLSSNGDDIRERLIQEKFIRSDQLYQFKPGYSFGGDPSTWDIKNNYIRHPDIGLEFFGRRRVIAVYGLKEPSTMRAVYFEADGSRGPDFDSRGIARLEWGNGDTRTVWNYEAFSGKKGEAIYPRRMSLQISDREKIFSEVIYIRPASRTQVQQFMSSWRNARKGGLSSRTVEALNLLLGFG